jgi:microcystin-dependent protein
MLKIMECYLGQIWKFGFFFAPAYWMECAGQTLQISAYQSLYVLLGTKYGGDGITTFNLPDMRSASLFDCGMKYYISTAGVWPSRP